ncbi:STAS-like domain-containing protein [Pediococcus pentosaceus]|uniref:STAS-like domain-containing protein n=1 Tax=Pediococcus pentosaceus TaxID=1255 RepID=UPI002073C3FF|nr:STAS-like domain-containing protein [Pediococcus pentosaceus]MCM6817736.1 STAS-like domain-containing protein [Pediococcus pentosaceus]
MILNIHDYINSSLAVSANQGQKVFEKITDTIKKDEKIIINFSELTTITTAFLNTAIGQLYNIGSGSTLNNYIHIDGNTLSPSQREKVRLVMQNAKHQLTPQETKEEMNRDD